MDIDGDLVTPLIAGEECAYTLFDKNHNCFCGVEVAFNAGESTLKNPISCWLYPIRTSTLSNGVMDQIKYNYIAQPGDIEKGVKLVADNLGVYDYYAINWLYKPLFSAKTPAQEVPTLKAMITEKMDDPRYYYGSEQNWSAYFDPRSIVEDLGNDKIKAAKYGIETLKYISANSTKWVNKDEADESYRELFIDFIFLKLYDYYRSLMVNIGGLEINRKYEGDPMPAYVPISKKIQRESLLFMLNQAEDLEWVNNKELIIMSGMNPSFSNYLANNMLKLVFQRIPMVAFAQNKSADAYTLDEMLTDITTFALKNMNKGLDPTEAQISTLFTTAQVLLNSSSLPNVIKAKEKNKAAFQFVEDDNPLSYRNLRARCFPNELVINDNISNGFSTNSGFETLISIKYLTEQNLSAVYYKHLIALRASLKTCLRKAKSEKSKDRISYLMLSIDKGIGLQ